MMTRAIFAQLLLAVLAGQCAAQSQTITVQYDAPSLDRWNYPFNGSPGTRLSASTFGAVDLEGFDDHDAQFIVGFDTLAGRSGLCLWGGYGSRFFLYSVLRAGRGTTTKSS